MTIHKRLRMVTLSAVVVSAMTGLTYVAHADDASRRFNLTARHSDMCLTVPRADERDGVQVDQEYCGGDTATHQQWLMPEWFDQTPSGKYFQIRSRDTGKCLTVPDASTDSGTPIIQTSCGSTDRGQLWYTGATEPSNAFELRSSVSHLCLTVPSFSHADGQGLIQGACAAGPYPAKANQLWALQELE